MKCEKGGRGKGEGGREKGEGEREKVYNLIKERLEMKIKFRGIVKDEKGGKKGQYAYGDLFTPWGENQSLKCIRETTDYHVDQFGHTVATCAHYEVEPDTVAQLVGYDKHGNEVYEGDVVKLNDGSEALVPPRAEYRWINFGELKGNG